MVEKRGEIGLVSRAKEWSEKIAILDGDGSHSYGDLLEASRSVAGSLLDRLGVPDLEESPVCFLAPPEFTYVRVQWGIWRAGGMAVPLAVSHPPRELAYVLDDARPPIVVAHSSMIDRLEPLAREREIPVVSTEELTADGGRHPDVAPDRAALMLYTSGTTGRPKGVVHTHGSLEAQMRTLTRAWEWTEDDRILLVLPLHHLHGLMNVLACALWSGASCRMHSGFDASETWNAIAAGDPTLFMAVPTIYHRLAGTWKNQEADVRESWSRGARAMRLMVSGSAALPVTLLEEWERITGHRLLERYGMTETGMILSNPLHGERRPGHVGQPLPGMEVRLVDEEGRAVPTQETVPTPGTVPVRGKVRVRETVETQADPESPGAPEGNVQVRGETLFREYWDRPDATAEAFTGHGWFRTGDVARLEDGSYRLLGRRSVDILKSGGYKISALEIESVLLEHPAIGEVAVVGVPDPEWGQVVSAAVVPTTSPAGGSETDRSEAGRSEAGESASGGSAGDEPAAGRAGAADSAAADSSLEPRDLRSWAKERLAPYKVPSRFLLVDALPRNAMGKVQKPDVVELFEAGR